MTTTTAVRAAAVPRVESHLICCAGPLAAVALARRGGARAGAAEDAALGQRGRVAPADKRRPRRRAPALVSQPPSADDACRGLTRSARLVAPPVCVHGPMSLPVLVPVLTRAPSVTSDDAASSAPKSAGKKRGHIYVCEQCAKQYKHPSCLIKHRWEHSPHWREASKFVQSKHQQVQLLEVHSSHPTHRMSLCSQKSQAAAILSHLSSTPTGTSLPEDRSLWPSFLSPGLVPPPAASNLSPSSSFARSASGPRMHDFGVAPAHALELRPGLLGVPGSVTDSSPAASFSFGERWAGSGSSPATSVSGGRPKYGMGMDLDDVAEHGAWSLPASDLRSSYEAQEEEAEVQEHEDEGPYAVGRREAEDEWAGDMDMD